MYTVYPYEPKLYFSVQKHRSDVPSNYSILVTLNLIRGDVNYYNDSSDRLYRFGILDPFKQHEIMSRMLRSL